ncbi:MAG TPA: hypothetical protein VFG29_14810 [Syntrophales bacterium]|nr:hypothetical protein [Syntrophales bacterium]
MPARVADGVDYVMTDGESITRTGARIPGAEGLPSKAVYQEGVDLTLSRKTGLDWYHYGW